MGGEGALVNLKQPISEKNSYVSQSLQFVAWPNAIVLQRVMGVWRVLTSIGSLKTFLDNYILPLMIWNFKPWLKVLIGTKSFLFQLKFI